jgi:hypothetical protein
VRVEANFVMVKRVKHGTAEHNRRCRHGSIKLAILSFASMSLGVQLFLVIKDYVKDARRLAEETTQRLAHPRSTLGATNEATNDFVSKRQFLSPISTIEEPATLQSIIGDATTEDLPHVREADRRNNATIAQTKQTPEEQLKSMWTLSSSWVSQEHLETFLRAVSQAHIKKPIKRPITASVAFYYTKIPRVVVAHTPRFDLLGSFVRPTIFLLAIARFYGWELEILPFQGSSGESTLKHNLALGADIDEAWGTGYQDVSNRDDYDPVDMNIRAYDVLSFFPKVSSSATEHEWIQSRRIPEDGVELQQLCQRHSSTNDTCYVQIPDDTNMIESFVDTHGRVDDFFPIEFRTSLREKFLSRNMARLKRLGYDMDAYNVVLHVRRGDINHPSRWIDQSVYYKIAHDICQTHEEARVHVFSAGRNTDTNWTTLEGLSGTSTFHSFRTERSLLITFQMFVRR